MKKLIAIIILIAAQLNSSTAQKLTVQASKTKVAVGEAFQISFTLNTNGGNFRPPNMSDFEVYSGPNQSTSVSVVNGSVTQAYIIYYVIAAKKEGKLTIGPASMSTAAGTVQSAPLTIEAVKGASGNGSNQSASSSGTDNVSDNLFVKTSVSKTKVVLGEQITITHKVYTRYQLRGFQDIKFPDYNGFWSQDLPMNNQQIQVTTENVDGVVYNVAELKHSYLFAQRTGKLQIEPMVASVVVRKRSGRQPRDIFDQLFGGGGYEDATYSVKSQPVTIDVLPLPETGKPAGFSGAVGDYSYKVELSKDRVKANNALNLTITLTGRGNIKLVEAPKISFPEDFETYDPKTKNNITVNAAGVSGVNTYDYLIIPRHEGDYKIDNLDFTFYNPAKNEYITLPSPELNIHVDKGDPGSASASVYTPGHKDDIKVLGNDIRYIKTGDPRLHEKDSHFFGSPLFYTGVISPFIAFFLFIFIRRKNIEQNKDAATVKSRKATRMAKKRLSAAGQHLKSNNKEAFYMEISQALYGYIGDKLNIAGVDLSKDNIVAILKNRQVKDATSERLIATLDNCEYARYAPSAVSGDLNAIYNNTVELITKIEDEIK